MKAPIFLLLSLMLAAWHGQALARDPVKKIAHIDFKAIDEMSGIAASRQFRGVYWVHNDSGDSARLFALDADGRVIVPPFMRRWFYGSGGHHRGRKPWTGVSVSGATNHDWEDIAVANGTLYVADMGNNGNARRNLGIYVMHEPDPMKAISVQPEKFIPVAYPDQHHFPAKQWHFDSESLFVSQGKVYILTKHRRAGHPRGFVPGTVLYRLDSLSPDRVNMLVRVEANAMIDTPTGADISPNGQWLAIICYRQVWLFPRPTHGDRWLSGQGRLLALDPMQTRQAEAVTWRNDHSLLIGNEQGDWFTLDVADIPAH